MVVGLFFFPQKQRFFCDGRVDHTVYLLFSIHFSTESPPAFGGGAFGGQVPGRLFCFVLIGFAQQSGKLLFLAHANCREGDLLLTSAKRLWNQVRLF